MPNLQIRKRFPECEKETKKLTGSQLQPVSVVFYELF